LENGRFMEMIQDHEQIAAQTAAPTLYRRLTDKPFAKTTGFDALIIFGSKTLARGNKRRVTFRKSNTDRKVNRVGCPEIFVRRMRPILLAEKLNKRRT